MGKRHPEEKQGGGAWRVGFAEASPLRFGHPMCNDASLEWPILNPPDFFPHHPVTFSIVSCY